MVEAGQWSCNSIVGRIVPIAALVSSEERVHGTSVDLVQWVQKHLISCN